MGNSISDVLLGANVNTNAVSGANGSINASMMNNIAGKGKQGASFAETFSFTSKDNTSEVNTNNTQQSKGKTVVENKPTKEVAEAEQPNKIENVSDDKKADIASEVVEDGKKVIEEIKKTFDVTDEDIEEAMATLAFSFENLFNTKDLQSLIMTVTNTADSVELLTNVDLYDGMNNIMKFMTDLKDSILTEFNIDETAFDEIITDNDLFEKVISEMENVATETVETDVNKEVVVSEDEVDASVVKDTQEKVETTVVADSKEVKEESKVKVEVKVEKTENVRTEDAVRRIVTDQNKPENNENHSDKGNQDKGNNDNPFTLFANEPQAVNNTVADVVEQVNSYTSTQDAENIMRQINDSIRVNITNESTSMELQLHPASLGTVNMQVISQNGQVTAHFTVQNEMVKAVLETQLMTLQENLNEAGTKVSAIEVTVANYNLDKGTNNGANENGANENNKGYSKRRNINLNGINSFDDFTDEELIEAKVMEMNGNTVNFRA